MSVTGYCSSKRLVTSAVDPVVFVLTIENKALAEIAGEISNRLQKVIKNL